MGNCCVNLNAVKKLDIHYFPAHTRVVVMTDDVLRPVDFDGFNMWVTEPVPNSLQDHKVFYGRDNYILVFDTIQNQVVSYAKRDFTPADSTLLIEIALDPWAWYTKMTR